MLPPFDPARGIYDYAADRDIEHEVQALRRAFPAAYRDAPQTDFAVLRCVLARLCDPHRRLPPVIHVAGTNGKGSVLAFLQAMIEAGGGKVHKFTSPHLVDFAERFVVGGAAVGRDDLLSAIARVRNAGSDAPLLFFEALTTMAFDLFASHPADVVLLETGMGGLHDATNAVGHTDVAVVTPVSYDHTHVLGADIKDIAAQKSGIIKHGASVVLSPQIFSDVAPVVARATAAAGASSFTWSHRVQPDGFVMTTPAFQARLPRPSLAGAHQVDNAATAVAALAALAARQQLFEKYLDTGTLAQALQTAVWPGRMQHITTGTLPALLPAGWELWLDGAHNDSGAAALAAVLQGFGRDKGLHLLTACKDKKDMARLYAPLAPLMATAQAVDFPIGVRMTPAAAVAASLRENGCAESSVATGVVAAIKSIVAQYRTPQRIVIAGSLYLVGHALRVNGGAR